MVVKPRTSRSRLCLANELLLRADTRDHVGDATWFVTHAYGHEFADTLDAVLLFFENRGDSASAKLWFDPFMFPRHEAAAFSNPQSWYMTGFKSTISRIGRMVVVVDSWNNPTALKRAWCLLELHAIAAKKAEGGGEFDVAMTATERLRFARCCKADLEEYRKMLSTVNVEAGVFFNCFAPSIRDDFKQHYKMFSAVGALAAHTASSEHPAAGDDARGGFNFGQPSEMVADLFKEWLEGALRKRISTLQDAGEHCEAMQWNNMLLRAVPEQHAAEPLRKSAPGAAAADNSS
jgi:hypothetical protein